MAKMFSCACASTFWAGAVALMLATIPALAVTAEAPSTCPSSWPISPGVCIWPKQQLYKNVSVAGDSDPGEKCCGICASEHRCASWMVKTVKSSGFGAYTCFLNSAIPSGSPPPNETCISGYAPPPTWPPTPPAVPAKKGAKNVLFFAVDDLRPDIAAYGDMNEGPIPGTHTPPMLTPNFDKLAGGALVCLKNYVQQAVCSPTRTSLLNGRRPDRTLVYDLFSYSRTVSANYTTIPEFFLQNGYKTMGMGKIFHPGHASGNDDSCCSWSNASAYFHAPNLGFWSGGAGNNGHSWMSVTPQAEAANPLPDNQTAVHAIETLDILKKEAAAGDKRPFFMAVGFHKPHLPFVASAQFFYPYNRANVQLPPDQQPPQGMPAIAWSSYGELRNYKDQSNYSGNPGTVLPSNDVLNLRTAYYAAVTQTDDMLGKVLRALDASGFADNTVISIWGDHGWQLGEHGEWCKHTNFEFATRAPMIIRVPGLTDAGIKTRFYTEHVDLFPTLAEAAALITIDVCKPGNESFGVALCTEGSSLVPLMSDPTTPVKTASFSQYPRGYVSRSETMQDVIESSSTSTSSTSSTPSTSPCIMNHGKGCTMGYTVVTRVDACEYRYTEWVDFNTPGFYHKMNWDRNVGVELYNHTADAGENFNINVTKPGNSVIQALSAKLSALLHAGPTYGNNNNNNNNNKNNNNNNNNNEID